MPPPLILLSDRRGEDVEISEKQWGDVRGEVHAG